MEEYVDHYSILGLKNTKEDISKAFRKLALKFHPDKQVNLSEKEKQTAQQRFEEISTANEILGNDQLKKEFDYIYFRKKELVERNARLDQETRRRIEELNRREREFNVKARELREKKRKYKSLLEKIKSKDKKFIESWYKKKKLLFEEKKEHEEQNKVFKLSWSRSKIHIEVTMEFLTDTFKRFGKVENVRIYGKKKNRALVTLGLMVSTDSVINSEVAKSLNLKVQLV
eukprot:maker-scaffold_18-snap-gene-2.65-mRNA-1 protein AED:0.03 eAED:0.09 QI:0/0/0.5/1/1/1/2/264/228